MNVNKVCQKQTNKQNHIFCYYSYKWSIMRKEKECPTLQTYIHICVSNKISEVYAMKDWHLLCGEEGVGWGWSWWVRGMRNTSSLQYQYSGGHGGEQHRRGISCYVCIFCTLLFFFLFFLLFYGVGWGSSQ